MASIADIEAAGYTVVVAHEPTDEQPQTIYSVTGFGVSVYITGDDTSAIASLAAGPPVEAPPAVRAPAPPPAADTVLAALTNLDPNTATVADVVTAVKSALAAAGATPAA